MNLIGNMCSEITLVKLLPHPPGANELMNWLTSCLKTNIFYSLTFILIILCTKNNCLPTHLCNWLHCGRFQLQGICMGRCLFYITCKFFSLLYWFVAQVQRSPHPTGLYHIFAFWKSLKIFNLFHSWKEKFIEVLVHLQPYCSDLLDWPLSQSKDCPSVIEATLSNMGS